MKRILLFAPFVAIIVIATMAIATAGGDEPTPRVEAVITEDPTTTAAVSVRPTNPPTATTRVARSTVTTPPLVSVPDAVPIVYGLPRPEAVPVEEVDVEPSDFQRPTDDTPPAPTVTLPVPPAGFDMRRPTLGPGGLYLPKDAADPDLLVVGGTYHLFSTNTNLANVPVYFSTDLESWRYGYDALPSLPGWASGSSGRVWAPSVHQVNNTFNLYFSAFNPATGRFCIGAAVSADPLGPYNPQASPLVCQTDRGGSIDPYLFTDDQAARYLIYKTDGNCCGLPSRLWSQRLTGDGLGLIGGPFQLLEAGAAWEAGLIEGPTMVKRNGRYHLFYSGNWWHTHFYAIGHAVCERISGPCYRSTVTPYMGNRSNGVGFGGPSIWESPNGEVWMTYHGWYGAGVGYENGGVRAAFSHRLDFPDWVPPPPPPPPPLPPLPPPPPPPTSTTTTVPSSTTTTVSTAPTTTTVASTTTVDGGSAPTSTRLPRSGSAPAAAP